MPRPLGGVVYFRGTPSVCPYALKLNEINFAFLSSKFKRTLRRTRSERLALFFHRTDFTSFRSGSVLRLRSAKTRNGVYPELVEELRIYSFWFMIPLTLSHCGRGSFER